MIASHDSFSYSKIRYSFYKLFSGIWKTQDITLQKQYTDYKVRYFDIRICKNKDKWIVCHGMVNFIYEFSSIEQLCQDINYRFPEAYYRIILEKGNEDDEWDFKEELYTLYTKSNLDEIVIKKNWRILKHSQFQYVDKTCKMNTLKEILEMFKYMFSIKKWSKKNNPKITNNMIEDKRTVYFLDYINIQ